jgi:hypothetical protein
MYIFK